MFPLAVMCVVEFIPPSVACPPIDNVEVDEPLMFPLAVISVMASKGACKLICVPCALILSTINKSVTSKSSEDTICSAVIVPLELMFPDAVMCPCVLKLPL